MGGIGCGGRIEPCLVTGCWRGVVVGGLLLLLPRASQQTLVLSDCRRQCGIINLHPWLPFTLSGSAWLTPPHTRYTTVSYHVFMYITIYILFYPPHIQRKFLKAHGGLLSAGSTVLPPEAFRPAHTKRTHVTERWVAWADWKAEGGAEGGVSRRGATGRVWTCLRAHWGSVPQFNRWLVRYQSNQTM